MPSGVASYIQDGRAYVDPDVFPGAQVVNGRLFIDPDLSSGLFTVVGGRPIMEIPVSLLGGVGISSGESSGTGAVYFNITQLGGVGIPGEESAGSGSLTSGTFYLSGIGIPSSESAGSGLAQAIANQLIGIGIRSEEFAGQGSLKHGTEPPRTPPYRIGWLLGGVYGPVEHLYELWVTNSTGDRLQRLQEVYGGGSVSFSNYSDTAWKLDITLKATDKFNPLSDRVLLTDTVSAGGHKEMFPMGMYIFDRPSAEHWESHSTWSLTGRSPEVLLLNDMPTTYFADTGTDILAEVRNILVGRGIPHSMIGLPQVRKSLRNPLRISPSASSQDAWWYRICNALLIAGGFYALTTTGEGRFWTALKADLSSQEPNITYGPGGDGMLFPPIGDTYEGERFANKVIVMSQDTQDDPPLISVRENHNPESAGSIPRMNGRIKMNPPITVDTVSSQADLDRIAETELQRSTSELRKLSLSTFPDPRLGPQMVIGIQGNIATSGGEPLTGNWNHINWSQGVGGTTEPTQHELSRIEPI